MKTSDYDKLVLAITRPDYPLDVNKLLKKAKDGDFLGRSDILVHAVYKKNESVVAQLLAKGATPNVRVIEAALRQGPLYGFSSNPGLVILEKLLNHSNESLFDASIGPDKTLLSRLLCSYDVTVDVSQQAKYLQILMRHNFSLQLQLSDLSMGRVYEKAKFWDKRNRQLSGALYSPSKSATVKLLS